MRRIDHSSAWQRGLILALIIAGILVALHWEQPALAPAAPAIFASPVHAGCYIARPTVCKIHVEPYTINVASGKTLVLFKLVAVQGGTGALTDIYDWRPDQNNPVPDSGTTYTPSPVAQDFAATCGKSYQVVLEGQDSGDANPLSLGATGQFTCPAAQYSLYLPATRR